MPTKLSSASDNFQQEKLQRKVPQKLTRRTREQDYQTKPRDGKYKKILYAQKDLEHGPGERGDGKRCCR